MGRLRGSSRPGRDKFRSDPLKAARLELLSGFGGMEAAGSLRCVGVAVLVQFHFANSVMCLRGMVCGSSQLTVELERADVRTVLIAYAAGAECLVHNG